MGLAAGEIRGVTFHIVLPDGRSRNFFGNLVKNNCNIFLVIVSYKYLSIEKYGGCRYIFTTNLHIGF